MVSLTCWWAFCYFNYLPCGRISNFLFPAGWPEDLYLVDSFRRAKTKMQSPLILGTESHPSGNHLPLYLSVPVNLYDTANGAGIGPGTFQFHFNPVVTLPNTVFVDQ